MFYFRQNFMHLSNSTHVHNASLLLDVFAYIHNIITLNNVIYLISLQGYGDLVHAEVIFNERGSKGFGFVTFSNPEDALRAKNDVSGRIVDGRRVEVSLLWMHEFHMYIIQCICLPYGFLSLSQRCTVTLFFVRAHECTVIEALLTYTFVCDQT